MDKDKKKPVLIKTSKNNDVASNQVPGIDANTEDKFPLTRINFILIAACGALIVIGFLLMIGSANDGATFNSDVFSARRVIVGPCLAFVGFMAMAIAILFKKKSK
ncbi:MAG: DUF3098 domain-containing protein [Muribaculaceae bacterium]|jgi:hypothetical protein|nr:DUF3098 domain-containing protein [Muribaculaceae bacterium]